MYNVVYYMFSEMTLAAVQAKPYNELSLGTQTEILHHALHGT
jgi:hypothetical protein